MLFIIYTLLGPPLGGLLYWAFSAIPIALMAMARDLDWNSQAWAAKLKLLTVYMSYSYLPGLLPAAACGITYMILRARFTSVRAAMLWLGLAGVMLEGLLLAASSAQLLAVFPEVLLTMVGVAGVSSAAIAGILEFMRLRRVPHEMQARLDT